MDNQRLTPPSCSAFLRSCPTQGCQFRYHRKVSSQLRSCPECGAVRPRCRKRPLVGRNACQSHCEALAGSPSSLRSPGTLSPEEQIRLDRLIEEDDCSLSREFHLGRVLLERALACLADERSSVQEIQSVISLIGTLAQIANTREKRLQATAALAVRNPVDWGAPEVQELLKESFKKVQLEAITDVLRWVIRKFDPDGLLGILGKLPHNLRELVVSHGASASPGGNGNGTGEVLALSLSVEAWKDRETD